MIGGVVLSIAGDAHLIISYVLLKADNLKPFWYLLLYQPSVLNLRTTHAYLYSLN
jgi:hypothetical protein